MKLVHCFPIPTDNVGISYTALSIYREQREAGLDVEFITPVIRKNAFGIGVKQCVPWYLRLLPWKHMSEHAAAYYAKALLDRAGPGVVFDLWSNHSASLVFALQRKRAKVVAEKFNCAQSVAARILNDEYSRIGLDKRCAITRESIGDELALLYQADFVVSPSPMVRQSLQHVGLRSAKIIDSSFGWDAYSIENKSGPDITRYPGPRFLFVGSVEVRKGAHLLLEYWKEAATSGTLIFMGAVREEMKPIIDHINAPNVVFLGHQEKAFGVYNQADVFVFPSLEEGSPLVTYEATARGLPCIVSPMGAGATVIPSSDAIICDPHDMAAWIAAFKTMAAAYGCPQAVKTRAEQFTWPKVAIQRYRAIIDRIAVTDLLEVLPTS